MSETEFSHRQHATAKQIFDGFYSALREQTDGGATVDLGKIDSIFGKFSLLWPSVLPLMERHCEACVVSRGARLQRDGRRKDYLTRLLFSRIVIMVPRRQSREGPAYPLTLARGMSEVVQAMFTPSEVGILNDHVLAIYEQAATDDDAALWAAVETNPSLAALVDRVFLQYLIRFRSFTSNRRTFLEAMRRGLAPGRADFSDADFCEVFEALFSRLFCLLEASKGIVALDLLGGEGAAARVAEIWDSYSHHRQSLSQARSGR
jgi:hypothetical protein